MNDLKLTPNQRAFCEIRFRHPELTAAECYMRAYPKCSSKNAAAVEASKNLNKPKIRKSIEQLSEQAAGHPGLSTGRILREEARLAFYDPRDLIDPKTGEILTLKDLPEHIARAIVSVRIIQTQSLRDSDLIRTEYRYKFADKGKALKRLSKHLGLYEKDNMQKPTKEKCSEPWVPIPLKRQLTLAEWSAQVEEMNRIQAEKEASGQATNTAGGRA